jgi:hypothetical protein
LRGVSEITPKKCRGIEGVTGERGNNWNFAISVYFTDKFWKENMERRGTFWIITSSKEVELWISMAL